MRQPVAILDSGVGGLTVAREIMNVLPNESIVYYGDTKRAPYGSLPASVVAKYTGQLVEVLKKFDPKMIVIACNTATALALDYVRRLTHIPVIGVIVPGARAALQTTNTGTIGVIGTEGTIRSRAYEETLELLSPGVAVISKACPEFVPLVEKGRLDGPEVERIVKASLRLFADSDLDCLILGCTHYPFLEPVIQRAVGPAVRLVSSAEETAKEVRDVLGRMGALAESPQYAEHLFMCSGDKKLFEAIANMWLGKQTAAGRHSGRLLRTV